MLKNKFIVTLTVRQLFFFGVHVGHLKKNSYFLSGWILSGWRNNIFIINLVKSFLLIKMGLRMVKNTIRVCRPFWFVSLNKVYGSLISRYALLCGEAFNIYHWIGGNLTNSRLILGWLSVLIFLMKQRKYVLRHMDKKVLNVLSGFLNKKIRRKKNVIFLNKVKGRHRWRYRGSLYYKKFKKSFRNKNWRARFNSTLFAYILEKGKRSWVTKKNFSRIIRRSKRSFFRRYLRRKGLLSTKRKKYFFVKRAFNRRVFKKVFALKNLFAYNRQNRYKLDDNVKLLIANMQKISGYRFFYSYKNRFKIKQRKFTRFLKFFNANYDYYVQMRYNFRKKLFKDKEDEFRKLRFLYIQRKKILGRLKSSFLSKKLRREFKSDLKNYSFLFKIVKDKIIKIDEKLAKKLMEVSKKVKSLRLYYGKYKRSYKRINYKIRNLFLLRKKFKSKFSYYYLKKEKNWRKRRIRFKKENASFIRVFKKYRWISPLDAWTKTRRPGGGFIPTFLHNKIVVNEFAKGNIPFITLVDSNIVSTSIFIPFPSNDDSSVCINFFCYLITKSIFMGKLYLLKKWKNRIKLNDRKASLRKKYLFNLYIQETWFVKKKKIFIDKKDSKFKTKNFISELLDLSFESFDIGNEIKGKLLIDYKALFNYEFDMNNYLKLYKI